MIERIFAGPNTSIRIIDTIITVILPSTIAESEFFVPLSRAPSTPIPIERIRPAIPGSVIVNEENTGK